MNEDYLLIEIQALIEAYETRMFKETRVASIEETDTYSLIGYQAPLIESQRILSDMYIASNNTYEKVLSPAVFETQNKESEDLNLSSVNNALTQNKPATEEKFFFADTYSIDIDGKKKEDANFFANDTQVKKNLNFYDDKPDELSYKYRLTNEVRSEAKFNLTGLLDKKIAGLYKKDANGNIIEKDPFSLEKCFNCFIKINLKFVSPAIEFLADFTKILNQIKNLLAQIEKDINPTEIFKAICRFKAAFSGNLMCPKNLIGLQLLLPNLFIKYSIDIMNFKFDASALWFPIIKAAIGAIVSLVENIPRLVIPFIECIRNSIIVTFSALDSLLASAQNVIGQVENAGNVISNTAANLYYGVVGEDETLGKKEAVQREAITSKKDKILGLEKSNLPEIRSGFFQEESDYVKKYVESNYSEEFNEKIRNLQQEWRGVVYSNEERKRTRRNMEPFTFMKVINLYEKEGYFKEGKNIYVNLFETDEKEMKHFQSFDSVNEIYKELVRGYNENENIRNVINEIAQKISSVKEEKEIEKPKTENREEEIEKPRVRKISAKVFAEHNTKLPSIEDGIDRRIEEVNKQIESDPEYIKAKRNNSLTEEKIKSISDRIYKENSIKFSPLNTQRKPKADKVAAFGYVRDKNVLEQLRNPKQVNPTDEWNLRDWLSAKYGFEIRWDYSNREPNVLSKVANGAKGFLQEQRDSLDSIEKVIVEELNKLEEYIYNTTNNIVMTFKGLSAYLDEQVQAQLKVLGNIRALLQIIRLARLVYELSQNGLKSCKEIKENKEVFKEIFAKVEPDSQVYLNNESKYLIEEGFTTLSLENNEDVLFIKRGNSLSTIDLNDCSEALNHLNVDNNNLDAIYEGIRNGIYER